MPISHAEMIEAQRAAVTRAMLERIADVGTAQYASDGDDDGLVQPIVTGVIRRSNGGAPWVSFGGGGYWYRWLDSPVAWCVLDADERPLGVSDRGPLVLTTVQSEWLAVVVNTGWNLEREIIW